MSLAEELYPAAIAPRSPTPNLSSGLSTLGKDTPTKPGQLYSPTVLATIASNVTLLTIFTYASPLRGTSPLHRTATILADKRRGYSTLSWHPSPLEPLGCKEGWYEGSVISVSMARGIRSTAGAGAS